MIFWKLLYTFCKIGVFNFGGGYAMIALIQNEVVEKNAWLTSKEFADIVATSQVTPGPIGINVATYTGYTAVVNSGYSEFFGILGALLASFSVMILPFILMLIVCKYLQKNHKNPIVQTVIRFLKIAVIGLIAAAAVLLVNSDTFGSYKYQTTQFVISLALFVSAFIASLKFKTSPILLLLVSGIVGFVAYYLI